jgi:hypothetical protein
MSDNNDDAKLLGVLKATVISKACRGRFVNVRRTIRDLELISDADYSSEGKDETSLTKLVSLLGNDAKQAKQNAKDISALSKAVQAIANSIKK